MTHNTTGQTVRFDRAMVGGMPFDFIAKEDVVHVIEAWRQKRKREMILVNNPHAVMLCHRDEKMRQATLSAGLVIPDGVGIVVGARLLGYGRRHRATGPATMLEVCDRGRAYGLRHYLYGGAEGVADRLAERLAEKYPSIHVVGTYCPPFRPLTDQEDRQVIDRINQTQPDVVWVGLGAPKQEKWMYDHVGKIETAALAGVGAAFDFHSGNVPWAPQWVRKMGLEWAHRLLVNPKRMWRRNLDSPIFLCRTVRQRISHILPGTDGKSVETRELCV